MNKLARRWGGALVLLASMAWEMFRRRNEDWQIELTVLNSDLDMPLAIERYRWTKGGAA